MLRLPRTLLRWSCVLGSAVLAVGPAAAASKAVVAAVGDAAPGGGVYAGPGFTDWPVAAGNGWMAFRGEVIGGTSSETLVVARMTAPPTRTRVASIGDVAPSDGVFSDCAGKLKEFVGHPAVNANGDVAFLALIQPILQPGQNDASQGPTRAGIFAMRGGVLAPVACSRQPTPGGTLDLVGQVGPATSTDDTPDRWPAINDAGDVAFLTAYVNADGAPTGGAVVLAPRAGGLLEVARTDAPFDDGRIVRLGPPALNNHGLLAFHGVATTTDPSDSDGMVDGVFTGDGQTLQVLVRDNVAPMPLSQPLVTFEDPVSLNDRGDVAFLAGPLVEDPSSSSSADAISGVFACRAGVVTMLAYPGEEIDSHIVTGTALGPFGGGALPTPAIGADGSVAFYVSLNDGNAEAIAAWDGDVVGMGEAVVRAVVYTAGKVAGTAPSGGSFAGAESAPALDGAGGIAFRVHLVGGPSSEAIVYLRPDGTTTSVALGEAAPRQNEGFFGGRAFTPPRLTDGGDVVFRAFVARGTASVGIFRWRNGRVDAIVRAGDPSPSGQNFLDLIGQPAVNQHGAIVFAAQVENEGRGIFVADGNGIRKVARRGDTAPGDDGTTFAGFGANPQINDAGTVAFRATTAFLDPATSLTTRREGIFIRSDAGIDALVYAASPSPAGLPFFKMRDPLLTAAPSVVFRAPLGDVSEQTSGIFTADDRQMADVALQQQPLGSGIVLSGFSGTPVVTPTGQVAFLATRAMPSDDPTMPPRSLGAAILSGNSAGLSLVVARDMPAPAGGTFKTLGQPAINASGTIAFRGSIQAAAGRTSGLFLDLATGLVPFLFRGEGSPIGGRIDTLGAQLAVNGFDEIAFSSSVTGGTASSGIFIASPTVVKTRALVLRLTGGRGRDRIAVRSVLAPGRLSNGLHPEAEPVTVSLRDANGVLWSATVPSSRLVRRRHSFLTRPVRGKKRQTDVRSLRVDVDRRGAAHIAIVSGPLDLTAGGTRTLAEPFVVGCEVGDDSGMGNAIPRVVRLRGPRGF
jgi:hypothetical protein